MIGALAALLSAQLIGEAVARGLALPIPGPVVGMLLLVAFLVVRRSVPASLDGTSRGLLEHLSLLFVPAGVGVMRYLDVLAREWVAIAVTIVASTLLTMLVTAGVMRALQRVFRS